MGLSISTEVTFRPGQTTIGINAAKSAKRSTFQHYSPHEPEIPLGGIPHGWEPLLYVISVPSRGLINSSSK